MEIILSMKEKLIFDPTILVQTKKDICGRASNALPPNFCIIICLLKNLFFVCTLNIFES